MEVAVVVPTLGVRNSLERLICSIDRQSVSICEVVIVNQGEASSVLSQIPSGLSFTVRVVESLPGVARARRVGIESLECNWDAVALADDDTWYADGALSVAASAIEAGADAVSGQVVTGGLDAPRVAFGADDMWLDDRSVWSSAIEAGLVLSRRFVERVGSFDESLGVGADSPWQSGEGTDLLLRGLGSGMKIRYVSRMVVYEDDLAVRDVGLLRLRLRNYARGTGRVYAMRYSRPRRGEFVLRSLGRLLMFKPRSWRGFLDGLSVFVGRMEGLAGRAKPLGKCVKPS
ncbi:MULTISPECIES: glycosyltransferase family 2 protein [Rhodococcus]|uniref:glycosyltransferase family 2 protein n=1 Tax=Rhodococcus TaxID=1827 RepID=UPI00218A194B|nr:glycosyltransferase family 2 protein [Rhodococcus sp. 11-3]